MVLVYSSNFGQQESQFTQYMHVPQIFNPAYVGNRRIMSLRTLARSQWLDLEGAPKTNLISFDSTNSSNIYSISISGDEKNIVDHVYKTFPKANISFAKKK